MSSPARSAGGQLGSGRPRTVALKDVKVDAKIVNVVPQITIQQTFYNDENLPVEAIYVFPVDERAAVCEFITKIGNKVVHGVMKEKTKAREYYQKTTADGHGAYLLEQILPDMFQISIGNLPPAEKAVVTISYFKLSNETPVHEYSIPTIFSSQEDPSHGSAYLAVEERLGSEKPQKRMATRRIPVAPSPSDYFYFGSQVGPKWERQVARRHEPHRTLSGGSDTFLPPRSQTSLGTGYSDDRGDVLASTTRRRRAESSCSTFFNRGISRVESTGSVESVGAVKAAIFDAIAAAVAEVAKGGEVDAAADSAAQSIGEAAATAVAEAYTNVSGEDPGSASSNAEAAAEEIAMTIAPAIAGGFGRATRGLVDAVASVREELVDVPIVEAVATATAGATSLGGSADQYSSAVSVAVKKAVAVAVANTLAVVEADVEAEAIAEIDLNPGDAMRETQNEGAIAGIRPAVAEAIAETPTRLARQRSLDRFTRRWMSESRAESRAESRSRSSVTGPGGRVSTPPVPGSSGDRYAPRPGGQMSPFPRPGGPTSPFPPPPYTTIYNNMQYAASSTHTGGTGTTNMSSSRKAYQHLREGNFPTPFPPRSIRTRERQLSLPSNGVLSEIVDEQITECFPESAREELPPSRSIQTQTPVVARKVKSTPESRAKHALDLYDCLLLGVSRKTKKKGRHGSLQW